MRKMISALVLAGAALTATAPAFAAEGCGAGWHRGPRGHCLANRPVAVVVAPRPVVVVRRPVVAAPAPRYVVGVWYPGRGWWNGSSFYWHRSRVRGVWVYR